MPHKKRRRPKGGAHDPYGALRFGASNIAMRVRANAVVLAAGLLVTLAGVPTGNARIFFAGTVLAGMGSGSVFQGALRSVLPLAEAHERTGLMAAFHVLSYLAFSVPAIIAGTMARVVGLRLTTDVYGVTLVALAGLTVVASGLGRGRRMVGG